MREKFLPLGTSPGNLYPTFSSRIFPQSAPCENFNLKEQFVSPRAVGEDFIIVFGWRLRKPPRWKTKKLCWQVLKLYQPTPRLLPEASAVPCSSPHIDTTPSGRARKNRHPLLSCASRPQVELPHLPVRYNTSEKIRASKRTSGCGSSASL